MKSAKERVMMWLHAAMIQSQIQRSLMLGIIIVTCLSVGTDLATKKSKAVFSKSIITAGVISPPVKTGALPLVGSTEAVVDMFLSSLGWIYAHSSKKSDER